MNYQMFSEGDELESLHSHKFRVVLLLEGREGERVFILFFNN